jgi:aquaporin Z
MKKYLAEMVGTMVLVLIGCGAAVSLGCTPGDPALSASVVGTAMAFGLAVVAMAYTIGGISGCHINPAITLGVWLSKRMSGKDAIMYIVFQIIGAIIGSAILFLLVSNAPGLQGTGANQCQTVGANTVTPVGGLIAEIVFTCVFVLVVLGTTDAKKGAGNFAGLAIGISLIIVHLCCIRYTGTSVNPARSIGPALFQGGEALNQLWIFIVGPFVGAILSALIWKLIGSDCKCEKEAEAK